MKGVLFTLTVFLIFSGVFFFIASSLTEHGKLSSERIGAQHTYYIWNSIADGVSDSLNLSIEKNNNTIEINDSLPAKDDVQKFLDDYSRFIDQKFKEANFEARFEDADGNKIDLSAMQSKFTIKPMNIAYIWPTLKKDRMRMQVDKKNFSYIKEINLTLFVSPQINNTQNIKWDPLKKCKGNTKYCLKFRLTIDDGVNIWVSSETEFDVDHKSELKGVNLGLGGGLDQNVKISIGELKDLIKIDPKNANVSSVMDLKLNTAKFFINYPARLNVSTLFAKKIDWL